MPDDGRKQHHSVSIDTRITAILARMRDRVVAEMQRRLSERHEAGRNELPDEEIEMISRIAGAICRTAADEAITEAYNIGREHALREPRGQ